MSRIEYSKESVLELIAQLPPNATKRDLMLPLGLSISGVAWALRRVGVSWSNEIGGRRKAASKEKAVARNRKYNALPEVKFRHAARQRTKQARAKSRWAEQWRLETDPQYKLKKYLRKRVRAILVEYKAPKIASALKLCGCTVEELRAHIESKFVRGMSWGNYGKWHIDHITPASKFNLLDHEQQRRCFHYLNLQPLWAAQNISKGGKILKPSQLPLGLAA